jgi:hypothetical protein
MTDLWVGVLLVGGGSAAMVALGLAAHRLRRGSAGPAIGAAMAAYDEAMHSTAYDTFIEAQEQADRTVPVPAPGDR